MRPVLAVTRFDNDQAFIYGNAKSLYKKAEKLATENSLDWNSIFEEAKQKPYHQMLAILDKYFTVILTGI